MQETEHTKMSKTLSPPLLAPSLVNQVRETRSVENVPHYHQK